MYFISSNRLVINKARIIQLSFESRTTLKKIKQFFKDINKYRNCTNKLIAWVWMILKELRKSKRKYYFT